MAGHLGSGWAGGSSEVGGGLVLIGVKVWGGWRENLVVYSLGW